MMFYLPTYGSALKEGSVEMFLNVNITVVLELSEVVYAFEIWQVTAYNAVC